MLIRTLKYSLIAAASIASLDVFAKEDHPAPALPRSDDPIPVFQSYRAQFPSAHPFFEEEAPAAKPPVKAPQLTPEQIAAVKAKMRLFGKLLKGAAQSIREDLGIDVTVSHQAPALSPEDKAEGELLYGKPDSAEMLAIRDQVVQHVVDFYNSPEYQKTVDAEHADEHKQIEDADMKALTNNGPAKFFESMFDQNGLDLMMVPPDPESYNGYTVGAQFVMRF